jgi:type II secretory pathway component PulF
MPLFSYKARNVQGEQISETLEAEDIKAAAGRIRELGYFPVSIQPFEPKQSLRKSLLGSRKINRNDVSVFTRRLADSLKGGLPLARALRVLENQTEKQELSNLTREIAALIQDGSSLSGALKNYPLIFSTVYVSMIKAGEAAGVLDVVLLKLADFNEKESEIRFKITSALAYPLVMLFVGLVSVIFLLTFVIPKFEVMFQDLGQALPLPTRVLIFASNGIRSYWWALLALTAGLFVFLKNSGASRKGRALFSRLALTIPVTGVFVRKELISRFIRLLNILVSNGVPILDALEIAKSSTGNRVFSDEIEKVRESVKQGQGLSKPLRNSKLFPALVPEIISIGEETGNLESSLGRIADIYEREVEYAVKTLTSLIEPVIILFAGVVVCFIALSMLLPVFQVSSGLH